MKDAIIITEGATKLHCIYENSVRVVSLKDPRCKLYIDKLSKHYNVRVASMTTGTAETLMKQIEDSQKLLRKEVKSKKDKKQHVEDIKTSTVYRTTCKGPLILGDIGITVDPEGFLDLRSLGAKAKISNDLKTCIRNGMLVKTTPSDIAKMAGNKREREYKADQRDIIDMKVSDFIDGPEPGGVNAAPIDLTNDVARMSDRQMNDPKTSMTALMDALDGE